MEDVFYYNELYDLYGNLLTDRQKEYFEEYYFNNLSLSEMAEEFNVSRNAISKQLHIVIEKMNEYEKILHLYEKKNKILKIVDNCNDLELKKELEDLI